MKKIILFLITIAILMLIPINKVYAKTASFYEAEYIENIWNFKKMPSGVIHYNQARIFRNAKTNEIAYCTEPFIYFKSGSTYSGTINPTNFSKEQINNLRLATHFGYGYKNHTDIKWYAITQHLIWQITNPEGKYFFQTKKTGAERLTFDNEINEIKTLMENYKMETSLNKKIYNTLVGEELIITDENNVLNTFQTDSNIVTIDNNKLIINTEKEGTYKIILTKSDNLYNKQSIFYQLDDNQDLIDIGDPEPIINEITINIIKTEVELNKIDHDTNTNISQGDALLEGTVFEIYKDNILYNTITLNEATSKIENLPLGNYYIQEKKTGKGYQLNNKKYSFTLTYENPKEKLTIPNKVIKSTLKIKKLYGINNNFKPEKNISFNIYDINSNLIKTITTDESGIAQIILPYGKYKLTQLTTTEGYQKITPIEFEITNNTEIFYELKDYKIPVPNTRTCSKNKIISFWSLLCEKIYSLLS